ncbi:polyphenol oxidase family protein [Helicobacter sp. 11S02629-2]|uniref:polyphenol oxidase family protein n=1 Tax=Helicobacter sp. 11S02629-2 TaxID=1476195 RepID=UPI000BA6DE84|nr:polyphenol oxidase family protein [Helicobacter sp. 11S02629-2]PAF45615.1 hypothetical protein BKH40_01670 [Helicobacter sp. 11S02629-2]
MFKNSKDLGLFRDECVDFIMSDASKDACSFKDKQDMLRLFGDKKLCELKQVHGDLIVDCKDIHEGKVIEADAIYSNDHNVVSLIKMADCAGILLYAKDLSAYVSLHAGREGVLKGIVSKAIKLLESKGARLDSILAYVSPHIKWCSYEVGSEIYVRAKKFCKEKDSKFYFDLESAIKSQLMVLESKNIYYEEADTFKEEGLFSYRRTKTSKRLGLFVSLKN